MAAGEIDRSYLYEDDKLLSKLRRHLQAPLKAPGVTGSAVISLVLFYFVAVAVHRDIEGSSTEVPLDKAKELIDEAREAEDARRMHTKAWTGIDVTHAPVMSDSPPFEVGPPGAPGELGAKTYTPIVYAGVDQRRALLCCKLHQCECDSELLKALSASPADSAVVGTDQVCRHLYSQHSNFAVALAKQVFEKAPSGAVPFNQKNEDPLEIWTDNSAPSTGKAPTSKKDQDPLAVWTLPEDEGSDVEQVASPRKHAQPKAETPR